MTPLGCDIVGFELLETVTIAPGVQCLWHMRYMALAQCVGTMGWHLWGKREGMEVRSQLGEAVELEEAPKGNVAEH